MKCIPSCGYSEKPDNLTRLTRHLEDCLANGACKSLKKVPFVVWRDGEFSVVEKKKKNETVFDVKLVEKRGITLSEKQIKRPSDYIRKPKTTQGTVSDQVEGKVKKVKAEIPEEFKK